MGIIIGPIISLHMLSSAIIGWGILSPIAKKKGWAPSEPSDWESGSRGWILWISLSCLLADCLINLIWPIAKYFKNNFIILYTESWNGVYYSTVPQEGESTPILQQSPEVFRRENRGGKDPNLRQMLTRRGSLLLALVITSAFCVFTLKMSFRFIPFYASVIAVALSLPLSLMGIRGLAETAYNPMSAIGKSTQLIFAAVMPRSNPRAILISLLANGVAEVGAGQAGDIAFDLKVGYLLGANKEFQLYGQIIGCGVGAFIATALYMLYSSVYKIPGQLFQVPQAYMAVLTARLVYGTGLPEKAGNFALGFGGFFALTSILKIRYAGQTWQHFLPSGTAFAIGIYNIPSFTLMRALGGILYWHQRSYAGRSKGFMIILASGLILGEGLFSIINMALSLAGVPKWAW